MSLPASHHRTTTPADMYTMRIRGTGPASRSPRSIAASLTRAWFIAGGVIAASVTVALVALLVNIFLVHPEMEQVYTERKAEQQVHRGMLDQESGLRGYLLTGENDFLDPYHQGTIDIREGLRGLSETPLPEFVAVEQAREEWATWASTALAVAMKGVPNIGTPPVSETLDEGKEIFDRYRAAEDVLREALEERTTASHTRSQRVQFEALVLELVVLVAAGVLWFRQRRRLRLIVEDPLQSLLTKMSGGKNLLVPGAPVQPPPAMTTDAPAEFQALDERLDEVGEELREKAAEHAEQARQLAVARDAALEGSRLKSEFVANMSHEIRTPMNGVLGMTHLLIKSDLTAEQREYAEIVSGSADALLVIINDILDFSKIEAGKLDIEEIDFDLGALIEDVADLMGYRAFEKGLELTNTTGPDVPTWVRGDPGRLRQILTNLLSNAVKFTREGEVTCAVIATDVTDTQATFTFEVTDTGIGIDSTQRERLFEAFTQADASTTREHGGTGLGLAISARLVNLLGGDLSVDSGDGAGSRFYFSLAMDLAEVRVVPPVSAGALFGKRILCVDDNHTNRLLLDRLITAWGAGVALAADAESALRIVRDAAPTDQAFDAVVLDLNMPGTDGLTLARQLASLDSLVPPMMMLTSSGQPGESNQAADAGITSYLTKPIRQHSLYQELAILVGSAPPKVRVARYKNHQVTPTGLRILVAEDNEVNQAVAREVLRKNGFEVDIAENGLEAVTALAVQKDGRYAAVLMDCQMPVMNGYDATTAIRESGNLIPIIAMTASALESDRQRCLAVGMNDYISKPARPDHIIAKITRWAQQIHTVDEPLDEQRETNNDAVLDQEVVAELHTLTPNPNFFGELVTAYISGADVRLAECVQGLETGDLDMVHKAVHALKGSAGSMGALRVARLADRLDDHARNGREEGARPLLEPLLQAQVATVEALHEAEAANQPEVGEPADTQGN